MKYENAQTRTERALTWLARSWLVAPLVRWHRRNMLYREMMSLDERTLAEIGMSRSDVPYFVLHADVDPAAERSATANGNDSADTPSADARLAA